MVVAMAEVEGLLPRVRTRGGEYRIGSRAATTVGDELVKDVSQRLFTRTSGGQITVKAINAALILRGEKLHAGSRQGHRAARRYAQDVICLYRQLCGVETGQHSLGQPPAP
jgi:hypothetical protein